MTIEGLAERALAQAKEEQLARQYAVLEASQIDSALFSLSTEIRQSVEDAQGRFNARLREYPSRMIDVLVQEGLYGLRLSRTQSRPHIQLTVTIEQGRYSVEVSGVRNGSALPMVRFTLKTQDNWPSLHNGERFVPLSEFAEKLIEYFA